MLNTLAVELSRKLNNPEPDVSMNIICPGPVNSNIIRSAPWVVRVVMRAIFFLFFQSPAKAAKPVVYMGISPDYEGMTASYLHMFNKKDMDPKVYMEEEGEKLWNHSKAVWERIDDRAMVCSF